MRISDWSSDVCSSDLITQAIHTAQAESDKPTLICCRTQIGFGAPTKQGKESSHGAPLGKDEIAGARAALGWPHAPFEIPQRSDERRVGNECVRTCRFRW